MTAIAVTRPIQQNSGVPRPVTIVNRWLRELPTSGCGWPRSWVTYGRALRDWLEFAADRGVGVFDTRGRLRELLGAYAAYRACGPAESRFGANTWAQRRADRPAQDGKRHPPPPPSTTN